MFQPFRARRELKDPRIACREISLRTRPALRTALMRPIVRYITFWCLSGRRFLPVTRSGRVGKLQVRREQPLSVLNCQFPAAARDRLDSCTYMADSGTNSSTVYRHRYRWLVLVIQNEARNASFYNGWLRIIHYNLCANKRRTLTVYHHGGVRDPLVRESRYNARVLAGKIDTRLIQFHGSVFSVRIITGFVEEVDVLGGRLAGQWMPPVDPLIGNLVVVEEPFDDEALARCVLKVVVAVEDYVIGLARLHRGWHVHALDDQLPWFCKTKRVSRSPAYCVLRIAC